MTTNDTHRLASVFTLADAKAGGMTFRQTVKVAGRVTRGIYAKDPTDLRFRIHAALIAGGSDSTICGLTALQWAKVDLPSRLARDTRTWIRVPADQHWPCRNEIRLVRPREPPPTTWIRQIPCVHLPYCWLQLAPECSVDELVELADAMTCRQHPVTTLQLLEEATAGMPGSRVITRARTALGLARPGTDSIPETDLRLLLVRAGLPCPVVNLEIRDEYGRTLFWLDLAYEEAKLAIEYDGAIHVGDRTHMERDATRRRILEDQGWRIITVTSSDLVKNPLAIIESVRRALART